MHFIILNYDAKFSSWRGFLKWEETIKKRMETLMFSQDAEKYLVRNPSPYISEFAEGTLFKLGA